MFFLPGALLGVAAIIAATKDRTYINDNDLDINNPTNSSKNALSADIADKESEDATYKPKTIYTLDEKMDILQSNIANIRKLSGLQTIKFAQRLKITKQALHNWETKKNKINYAQYSLLTDFFLSLPLLKSIKCDAYSFLKIVVILLYPELYSKEDLKKYQETITALANLSRNNSQVSTIFNELLKNLPSKLPEELFSLNKDHAKLLNYFLANK